MWGCKGGRDDRKEAVAPDQPPTDCALFRPLGGSVYWGKWQRGRKRERKKERDNETVSGREREIDIEREREK